jgi:uncharacterized Tic20 family protein
MGSSGKGYGDVTLRGEWVERMLAVVAYLGFLAAPLLFPLVIYLAVRARNRFVQFHAAQAFNVQLACVLVFAAVVAVGELSKVLTFFSVLAFIMVLGGMISEFAVIVTLIFLAVDSAKGRLVQAPRWLNLRVLH